MNTTPIFKFAIREDLKDCSALFLPSKANSTDTGYDVRAAFPDRKPLEVLPGTWLKIPLGFRAIPEEGYWYEIRPRSSTFAKKHLNCLYGVIDYGYRNELVLACKFEGLRTITVVPGGSLLQEGITIDFGEALGQIIPVKLQTMHVQEISNEEYDIFCKNENNARTGGFGSSDEKKK